MHTFEHLHVVQHYFSLVGQDTFIHAPYNHLDRQVIVLDLAIAAFVPVRRGLAFVPVLRSSLFVPVLRSSRLALVPVLRSSRSRTVSFTRFT